MEPLLKLPKPIWIVNHLNGRKEVFDEYMRLHRGQYQVKFQSKSYTKWYQNDEPWLYVEFPNGRSISFDDYMGVFKTRNVVQRRNGWYYFMSICLAETHIFHDRYVGLKSDTCGKWMFFFSDQELAKDMCKAAIEWQACLECKCTDMDFKGETTGVACFYLNVDDIEGHKKLLWFMKDNDLIRKTKTGKYYNISFKLDDQTRADEYGDKFEGKIKLSDFIDLETGKFIK